MIFPLHKSKFSIRNNAEFLSKYDDSVELPIGNHPGSFGFVRKNHIHEGLDFYCEKGDEVYAIVDGEIISIQYFTGEKVGSPWWNNTQSILIRHEKFSFNYGEIEVEKNLHVGDKVHSGQLIGKIIPVLKIDKGRPMNMLHLEMYKNRRGTSKTELVKEWKLGTRRPKNLLDPTSFMKIFFEK